jgi:predicted nuclease of predicted toxin-antitoxin system
VRFPKIANVEFRLATFLTSLHHDVKTIAHDYPHSLSDREVLALSVQEHRILLTNDRDFGELIFRQHLPHTGVILFRMKNSKDIATKQRQLHTALHRYPHQLHHFLVLTAQGIRIRKITGIIAA